MRHLMSPLDFTIEELDKLFDLANDIVKQGEIRPHLRRQDSGNLLLRAQY